MPLKTLQNQLRETLSQPPIPVTIDSYPPSEHELFSSGRRRERNIVCRLMTAGFATSVSEASLRHITILGLGEAVT